MEPFNQFSLEVTKWLQENYFQLDPLFEAVSFAVRFEVYLVIIPLIYWCLEKRLGRSPDEGDAVVYSFDNDGDLGIMVM